jgi:hypothetical protein
LESPVGALRDSRCSSAAASGFAGHYLPEQKQPRKSQYSASGFRRSATVINPVARPSQGLVGPVTVVLEAQTATGAQGNNTFSSIEGVAGTLFHGTLLGSNSADILSLNDEGSEPIDGRQSDDHLEGDAFFLGVEDLLRGRIPSTGPGRGHLRGRRGSMNR